MADALKKAWEPVWNKPDPEQRSIDDYPDYDKKVDPDTILLITLELVTNTITKSKDSSTGPYGVPFAMYRHLIDLAAPMLFHYTLHLAGSKQANKSFNFSNLFFFPKDTSNTPLKQRPIAVSNTDNRLIANAIRRSISPAISAILTKTQKAFVLGASIEDNIRHYNEEFYRRLGKGDDYHLFLHDFQKAYDSVSRRYLMTLLRKIGLPDPFVHVIETLFTKNRGLPILRSHHKTRLTMTNGLKQGCPLSPLLFNLVLDPLLAQLNRVALADERAYCDDLAVGSPFLNQIAKTLPYIDRFNLASGSCSNRKKIFLLSTREVHPSELISAGFPKEWSECTQIVPSARYLGVCFGRMVTIDDIFRGAMHSLSKRVADYMTVKDMYSTQNRVMIANCFLLPVLSYLQRFFMMSQEHTQEVERLMTSWIVSGHRFTHDHLTSPSRQAGLNQPLRDPYLSNIAALLRRKEEDSPPPPPQDPDRAPTLRITDHIREATAAYRHFTNHEPPADLSQRQLYDILQRNDETTLYALAKKLDPAEKRIGKEVALQLAKVILSNTGLLPARLSSSLRFHAFRLVHNALPTRMRDRWRGGSTVCPFCGVGDESLAHLHTKCPTTTRAIGIIAQYTPDKTTLAALREAEPDDFVFRSPTPWTESERLTLLLFSAAIWQARSHFASHPFTPLFPNQAANKIAHLFRELKATTTKRPKKRNRTRQRQEFLALLTTIPPTTSAYTDGSSFGNPGPAGAGFVIYSPDNTPIAHRSSDLGNTTNNVAELTALLQAILWLIDHPPPNGVAFFIDNMLTINLAEGKWKAKSSRRLVDSLLSTLARLRAITTVSFYWVPGHALILGNEVADWMAKQGAKGSPSSDAPPDAVSQEIRARCNLPANAQIPEECIPCREQDQDHKSMPSQSSQALQPPPHPPPPPQPPPPKPGVCRPGRPKRPAPLISGIDFSMSQRQSKRVKAS